MTTYAVYYARKGTHFGCNPFARSTLKTTHRFIKTVDVQELRNVFFEMQGETWSPRGEARPIIENAGVRHTSMSVGDIVLDLETHTYFVCAEYGWRELAETPDANDLKLYIGDVERLANDEKTFKLAPYYQCLFNDLKGIKQ